MAPLLAKQYTVITYDRRGRGESGDTQPYDISREIEDIKALVQHLGEFAFLYGISSGGALALEAASRLPIIKKLAIYEVPFIVDNTRAAVPPDYLAKLTKLVESGQRGAAIKFFMKTGVGLPAILVALMPIMPGWSKMKSIAHTLINDTTFIRLFPERVSITYRTLVLRYDAHSCYRWWEKSIVGTQWREVSRQYFTECGI